MKRRSWSPRGTIRQLIRDAVEELRNPHQLRMLKEHTARAIFVTSDSRGCPMLPTRTACSTIWKSYYEIVGMFFTDDQFLVSADYTQPKDCNWQKTDCRLSGGAVIGRGGWCGGARKVLERPCKTLVLSVNPGKRVNFFKQLVYSSYWRRHSLYPTRRIPTLLRRWWSCYFAVSPPLLCCSDCLLDTFYWWGDWFDPV